MLLGIDVGTSSLKAALIDTDGQVVASKSAAYEVSSPRPGWAETHPLDWWRACVQAVRGLTEKTSSSVEAVGLSGQMHGVVLVSGDGRALRPAILWPDTRSRHQLAAYERLPTSARDGLANPLFTGMAGPSLLWLIAHEPDAYRAARHALQPKDWLRMRLTGRAAADPSDASGTLLYDLKADDWSTPAATALGIRRDLLQPLIASEAPAGELHEAAARELNLRPGVPVAAGAGDTAAAAVGSGLVETGDIQLTVGTGAQIVAPLKEPRPDPTLRTHLFRAAAPSRWYALAAIQNAGLALEWARKLLGASWEEVYEEAFSVAQGADRLSFIPYLTGERTPHLDIDARGAWIGLGLSHERSHLLRACLEGVAFSLRAGLDALAERGIEASELRIAGGGSVRREWRQMLADVLGRPLVAVTAADASARGAALLAGVACGVYEDVFATAPLTRAPTPAADPVRDSNAYDDAYARFCRVYTALRSERSSI